MPWMPAIALICLMFSGHVLAKTEGELEAGLVAPGYHEKPAWFHDSFLDIREDISEAADEGRGLLLYFYQDGCPYCAKLLQDNFGQAEIADKTQARFNTIAINLWGDREVTNLAGELTSEKDFARNLRVQFTPTLLMLDAAGEVKLRINGYYPPHRFDTALDWFGQAGERGRFVDYLVARQPQAASGKLHGGEGYLDPAQLGRRNGDKPLLVFFEQRQCAACDELHLDVLKRAESQELLAKFDLAVVDIWSSAPVQTAEGKLMPARRWARDLGIHYAPSLVFFDAAGGELFRTEAYLKAFHIQTALDYVASGAWRDQPEFQRFLDTRADALRAAGKEVNIME